MDDFIPNHYYTIVSSLLFAIGLAIALTKNNAILILMGVELMLNAANLNFVAFSRNDTSLLQGHIMALFVIVVAASEAAVALAIIIKAYKFFASLDLQKIKQIKVKQSIQ